jgi:hypothetical protein
VSSSEEVGATERQKKAAIDRIEPKPARALAMATSKGVSSHPRCHCLSKQLPNPHGGMHTECNPQLVLVLMATTNRWKEQCTLASRLQKQTRWHVVRSDTDEGQETQLDEMLKVPRDTGLEQSKRIRNRQMSVHHDHA